MLGRFNPFGLISLVIAITVHEFSHAWAANRLGDPTPKLQGRLNLNPLSHLDPIGSLALLLIGFGWGKPVQFDPYNLANPRRDSMIISLAGPLSNLLLALIAAFFLRVSLPVNAHAFLVVFVYYNVLLAIFNIIPIHPLDGGKILVGILPRDLAHDIDMFLRQYGMILLLLIIFPFFGGTPLVHRFISPIIEFLISILLPTGGRFI